MNLCVKGFFAVVILSLSTVCADFKDFFAQTTISKEITKQEIEYYNEQIQSLTNLRDYYAAKAVRYRNRANHFEYQNGPDSLTESKKLKRQAEEYEMIVARIDEELVKLHEKRDILVEKMEISPPGGS